MGAATGKSVLVERQTVCHAAVAANADLEVPGFRAPFTGVVTSVYKIPPTTLTGADTQSRTVSVYNRGAAGAGTTLVAQKAFTTGVDAAAKDETEITLVATAANLNVTEGDILSAESLHVGTTGLADPGGAIRITYTRD